MDKTPDDGGGSTWIRDLFVRIRGTGGASPPRRLANASHSTPATPRGERRIVSSGSGTIYFDAVSDVEVDRRVITPFGPNSDPEIGSTSAPGPDQPPSLTKPECLPEEPDANPTVFHGPLPPNSAAVSMERTVFTGEHEDPLRIGNNEVYALTLSGLNSQDAQSFRQVSSGCRYVYDSFWATTGGLIRRFSNPTFTKQDKRGGWFKWFKPPKK